MLQVWLHQSLYKKYDLYDDIHAGYGICNRLDINTSGIVLVAKNEPSYTYLRNSINDHIHTVKRYFALVDGLIDENGQISVKIDCTKNGLSQKCFNTTAEGGNYALTYFFVICHLKDKNGKDYTLLDVHIKTGRTHQIRVHMKMLNTNIIGDGLYTKNLDTFKYESALVPRIFLHAYYYKFTDQNGENISVFYPLAIDLLDAIKNNFNVNDSELSKDDVIYYLENPDKIAPNLIEHDLENQKNEPPRKYSAAEEKAYQQKQYKKQSFNKQNRDQSKNKKHGRTKHILKHESEFDSDSSVFD
jgi:hypothetical protein